MRAAFEQLGFERVRSSYRMEIDLARSSRSRPSRRIDIRPIREGEERIAYDIHQESFRDSWEHTAEPFDEWRHYLVDNESFDRGLWFVAWDGDRPAGAALCRVRDGVGWIGILGVLREWRRRGIGRALLLRSFDEFKRRGLLRAGLGVDAESLTGANRLYESAGMHVVPARLLRQAARAVAGLVVSVLVVVVLRVPVAARLLVAAVVLAAAVALARRLVTVVVDRGRRRGGWRGTTGGGGESSRALLSAQASSRRLRFFGLVPLRRLRRVGARGSAARGGARVRRRRRRDGLRSRGLLGNDGGGIRDRIGAG